MRDQGSIWRWIDLAVLFLAVGQPAYGQAVPGRSVAVGSMANVLHRPGPLPGSQFRPPPFCAMASETDGEERQQDSLEGFDSDSWVDCGWKSELSERVRASESSVSVSEVFLPTFPHSESRPSGISKCGTFQKEVGEGSQDCASQVFNIDSLKLHLLTLDIARAELDVSKTDLWHRLIPEVHVSANFGVQQLVFIDPTSFTPYMLPKDSYRFTLSLSLSGVFAMAEHDRAILTLESLQAQHELLRTQQNIDRQLRAMRLSTLSNERYLIEQELKLTEEILRYTQLLFDQGKTDFDNLMKAKLQVIQVQKSLNAIEAKINAQ